MFVKGCQEEFKMLKVRLAMFALMVIAGAMFFTVQGQGRPDPAALLAAQKEAMAPLAFMDGVWRGPAWTS